MIRNLLSRFRKTPTHILVVEVDRDALEREPLSDETQLMVATESALVAAIELVILQKDSWNQLVESLEENGMSVGITDEAQERFDSIMLRLNAAMQVAGEVIGIDKETMEGLFND